MRARSSSSSNLISRDNLDKVALVVAFLVGSAGSWGIKYLGLGPFLAAGWAAGAMLLYVAAVMLLGRLRIEPEAIGDNCYYLGFLLTLSSLSATLYQLAQSEEQTELMRSIVSGFGIALISTILGILLRVVFIQLRPDIVARDRETRIELQHAARDLRLELATSVATIKQFSTEAIQLASEQGSRISEATSAGVDAQRSRMQSDVKTYTAMLQRTLEEAGTQSVRTIADNVTLAATDAQASIRHSLEEIGRAIGEFAAAQAGVLDAREVDAARAAAIGDAALVRAATVADEIEAVGARVGGALRQVGDALERSAEAIEGAGVRIQRAEEAVSAARRAAEASADAAARSARDARRSTGWWPFRGRG